MAARTIRTEIEIEAPRSHVWTVLTDWPRYGEWNPWMTSVTGELELGARLAVQLRLGERVMDFAPTVVHLDDGRGFGWLGHTFVRGLFDGEHMFELEAVTSDRTRLHHFENFRGMLSRVVLGMIGTQTQQGFGDMNQALKARCESM